VLRGHLRREDERHASRVRRRGGAEKATTQVWAQAESVVSMGQEDL